MEIKINHLKESFTIKDNKINGITGKTKESIVEKVYLKSNTSDEITIQKKKVKKELISFYKQKIYYVEEQLDFFYLGLKVYEAMYLEIKRKRLSLKDPKKKIVDSLKLVGLNITYLNRNIKDLSTSERKLLQIGMAFMSNPEVIILMEPFKGFDKKTERKMILFLQKIKELYEKTIVIVSNNSEILYRYADHVIVGKKDYSILEGKPEEIYERVDFLKKQGIQVPEIVEFTYLAKKKKAKIDYHKDIRDIIKDIYKHV